MPALMRGPTGKLLRTASGKLARGRDCCCDIPSCDCGPCALIEYNINDDGTYVPTTITFNAVGSIKLLLDADGSVCLYQAGDLGNGIQQLEIRLVDPDCQDPNFPTEINIITGSLTYGNKSTLVGGMPNVDGGYPYDSGLVPIYKNYIVGNQVGTMRIRTFSGEDCADAVEG